MSAPHTAAPRSWSDRLQAALLAALVIVSVLYLGLFLFIAATRLTFPYQLEWMEGASIDTVNRILSGQPVYPFPTLDYVAPVYTPLSYYLSAAIALVTGPGFVAHRLLSLLATLGSFALVFAFVRRATGRPAFGIIAAGLLAATFDATGGWFDLARVDGLLLCLLLASWYVLYFMPTQRGYALAGTLLALAFLTKQSAAVIIIGAGAFTLLTRPRLLIGLVPPTAAIIGGVTLLLNTLSGGGYWYATYTVNVALQLGGDPTQVLGFWQNDMVRLGGAVLLTLVLVIERIRARSIITARFWMVLLASVILTAWVSRIRSGGWVNVLFPVYGLLALGFGVGLERLTRQRALRAGLVSAVYALLLVQFAALVYNPADHLPTAAHRAAGDALIARLAAADGDILMPATGYYPTLAGADCCQLGWSYVVTIIPSGTIEQAYMDAVTAAIADQRFAAIVLDGALFTHERFSRVIDTYYQAEPLPYPPADLTPITGLDTHPLWLLTPRPGAADD